MATRLAVTASLATLATLGALALLKTAPAKQTTSTAPSVVADTVAGGTHWRIATSKGAIHVWRPANYRPATAGLVLYAHGFGTDVDGAWKSHRLAEQFRTSNRNALFIAPEVRSSGRDRLRWTDLGSLVRTVRAATGLHRPWGEVVAVGHSGAFRTIARWLDYSGLDTVVLLDGLYGAQHKYSAWLRQNARHRLIMTSSDTLERSEPMARQHQALTFDLLPEHDDPVEPAARTSQFVYFRSQLSHMALVEDGGVIPTLLRLTTLHSL